MAFDPQTCEKIITSLRLGMPLTSVADYMRIPMSELRAEMKRDAEFKAEVNRAIAVCMHDQLEKLEALRNWQAVAFILQSLWPTRFGRRSVGARKPRKQAAPAQAFDLGRLTPQETQYLDRLLDIAHGRNRQDGSGFDLPAETGK